MKNNSARSRQSGVALITTMIVVMVAAGMAAAFLTLAFNQSSKISEASKAELALHVAESGIDDAINKLNAYALRYVADTSIPLTAGNKILTFGSPTPDFAVMQNNLPEFSGTVNGNSFTVKITNTNATTPTPVFQGPFSTNYILTSKGTNGQMRRDLEVIVSAVDDGNLFKYGLFGDVEIEAGGGFSSDGFDSALGTWASQATMKPIGTGRDFMYAKATGNLGSNNDISTSGSSTVMGNVTPGPGGTLNASGFISGSTTPAPATLPLDAVNAEVPVGTPSASWTSGSTTIGTGANSSFQMSELNSNGGGPGQTLTVVGNVTLYVAGDFIMNSNQTIQIGDPAAPGVQSSLTIIQAAAPVGSPANNIHINGQAFAGTAQARDFIIKSATTGKITFNGGADVYAAVYAPDAVFRHNGNANFYGAMVAKTMALSGNAYFHYDEDLARLSTPRPRFKIVSWRRELTGKRASD